MKKRLLLLMLLLGLGGCSLEKKYVQIDDMKHTLDMIRTELNDHAEAINRVQSQQIKMIQEKDAVEADLHSSYPKIKDSKVCRAMEAESYRTRACLGVNACQKKNGVLSCVRPLGHRGKHHAHGTYSCFKIW